MHMIWKLLWLFLIYSFAGWVLETVLASETEEIRKQRYY